MRSLAILPALAFASAAWAVDWRPLPSPTEYQSTVDLDSVKANKGFTRFTVRRAYASAQKLPSGKDFFSTRLEYISDCNDRTATLVVTQYYGEDKKLIQADVRPRVKRSEFASSEPGSELAEALKLACIRVAESGGSQPAAPRKLEPSQAAPSRPALPGTSGSGIVVHRDGTILTNQHVVKACNSYEVIDDLNRRLKASLLAVDPTRDLALLKADQGFRSAAVLRKDIHPRLGEAVTVVGYPLVSVLGARPSVNFGNVTSTVGVRGDPTQMQISVPIQRGASGGPVLDQAGNVIGVVVSKLDALKLAERVGDLPQNVNFAIRGEFARNFLEANRIELTVSSDTAPLESTEIASQGAAVTVRVRCMREAALAPAPAVKHQ
ncbi:MAG: trypsin-like peptidase domain-containing protein [Betaproteobacteria bacterium]|nr:trypsin-like peptidase domain-containing protein [Betaproteobacteria bacterium]